jgi:hypothetical protein
MAENGAEIHNPASSPRARGRLAEICARAMGRIPPKARLALLTGSMVLIGFVIYGAISSGQSTLHLLVRHNLRDADLTVVMDGKLVLTEHLSGSAKKRLGLFEHVDGAFSKSLAVRSGEHVVQVHLQSAAEGMNQSKASRINIPSGNEATVSVSATRSTMNLSYQGAAPSDSAASSHLTESAVSVFLTVAGSAASAAVGFFVQEFLRSKNRATNA